MIPSFFGGVEMTNVSLIFGGHGRMDHVQCGGIELLVHHFSSCRVLWVEANESFFNDPPQFGRGTINMGGA